MNKRSKLLIVGIIVAALCALAVVLLGTTDVFKRKPADSAALNGYTAAEMPEDMPEPNEDLDWGEEESKNYWASQKAPYKEETAEPRDDSKLLEKQEAGLLNLEVGGSVLFGEYEQDDDTKNGPEEIEWLVLDKDENGRYLLLSKMLLDMKPYYVEYSPWATWDRSNARYWLNTAFLNKAFPTSEQVLIPEVTVKSAGNAQFGTYGGQDTKDRCFLFSAEEVLKYLPTDESRRAKCTAVVDRLSGYPHMTGEYAQYQEFRAWVLRTPSEKSNMTCAITISGDSPYIEDYTLEEIIENVMNDESLSDAEKEEAVEKYKNGSWSSRRGGNTGGPQFLPVGIRPALWVDIGSLK